MFCANCGTKSFEEAVFCVNCGAVLEDDDTVQVSSPLPSITPQASKYPGMTSMPPPIVTEAAKAPFVPAPSPSVSPGRKRGKNNTWILILASAVAVILIAGVVLLMLGVIKWPGGESDRGDPSPSSKRTIDTSGDNNDSDPTSTRTSGTSDDNNDSDPTTTQTSDTPDDGDIKEIVLNITGNTKAQVESELISLGIIPIFVYIPDESPAGTVLSIERQGERIVVPVEITVHISSGPPKPPPEPSTMGISGHTLPPDQKAGAIFGVRGIIESNYKILSVTVAVYNDKGVMETGKTVSPNAYTYDIRDVDYDILFDILTVGNKTYVVEAEDEMGVKTLLSYPFRVSS